MIGDLTPSQYLTIREAMKANPDANAAWIALKLGLPRESVEQAFRMASK